MKIKTGIKAGGNGPDYGAEVGIRDRKRDGSCQD